MSDKKSDYLGKDGEPKYFYSELKAQAFIDKKGAGETHTVGRDGDKYTVVYKSEQ